ncbi:DNA-binding CsgD family transcriptional regulator [Sinorhizobium fredii]|uniref:helix-turn-helix transcriptional regulator n=1 Tax=Rhizobium fredii TaxID=380 RepID=UPI003513DE44
MGQSRVGTYSEKHVAAISADLAASIDAAAFGAGSWDEVPGVLSHAFPGSFGGLWNMNFAESRLNFLAVRNIDPAFAKSFSDHFAYINPWIPYWSGARSGITALSEEVFPARTFADTEFYNDWLRPQKDVEAGAGMKILGDRGETIQFIMNFPLSLSETYGKAAVEVLTRVRGNLERSISLARLMRTGVEQTMAAAALVERNRCAAFVVEGDRLVREANQMALQIVSSGQALIVRSDRCFIANTDADARFGSFLAKLSQGIPTDGERISFRTSAGAWQITMAALPPAEPARTNISLLPPRQLILVLVTELNPAIPDTADLSTLSAIFTLTPSEIMFCRRLVNGESVADAAEQLGITVETARTRLKSILQKTGTSRQGQLMLLLSRLQ